MLPLVIAAIALLLPHVSFILLFHPHCSTCLIRCAASVRIKYRLRFSPFIGWITWFSAWDPFGRGVVNRDTWQIL